MTHNNIKSWMTQHKLQQNSEKTGAVLVKTRQTSTEQWKDRSSARQNKTKTVLHFRQHHCLKIPQSLSLTLSKASAFSSTAHWPWRTSLVKPPNPAATSSVELVLSGSIVSPRLQRNWSPHSFCHASTTAALSFLVCLLPLSIAIVAYRTVLFALYQDSQGP